MVRAISIAAAALALLAAAAPADAGAVSRGVADVELVESTPAERVRQMDEFAQLRCRYLRVNLQWNLAEPAADAYDEDYLAVIADIVALAKERDIRLILTVVSTPRWASDEDLWQSPPTSTYAAGAYQPFYAPALDHVDDFGDFARDIAARFAGDVFAYECWNEPNLWTFLYPQTRTGDDDFAVTRYAQLLDAFYAGVKATDADAVVIGGATAPIGTNDKYRTSPQRFARLLKNLGGASDMDAYSHHPYVPGGSTNTAPESQPTHPQTTVQLANLATLLKLYPGKPFYLTEYGYNTSYSLMFGGVPVSQATQAGYLRRAYRYAARYSRVRALIWYLRRDRAPSAGDDMYGVYTGLRTTTGARKRSWFAFAGGNRLSLEAPAAVHSGATTTLRGALTCIRLATSTGGLAGKTLQLQRRTSAGWRTLKTVVTGSGGTYRTGTRPTTTSCYRLRWAGVVVSPVRRVTVR